MNKFYKKWCLESSTSNTQTELTEMNAELYFTAAVKWIRSNINWNFSNAMAENILTELLSEHRFNDSTGNMRPSTNHDLLYLYKHRGGKPHPLYRWKTDTHGTATLEAMLPSRQPSSGNVHCIFRTCCAGGGRAADKGHSDYWTHLLVAGNGFPQPISKYIVESNTQRFSFRI
jgi:hypothetical protein